MPLYVFAFSFGVINPVIYFAFNGAYREEHLAHAAKLRDTICRRGTCCFNIRCDCRCRCHMDCGWCRACCGCCCEGSKEADSPLDTL